jgi:BirA family transcriptional regulator, biotin operon repressor / biotin---[acetyl-CoA-carboxylase] ligase
LIDKDKIEKSLAANSFVERVYYFSEIESTNDFARTVKSPGAFIVLTNHQTGGRGRYDRSWLSEANSNLTFTLRKHIDIAENKFQYVNFMVSCSLYEAIREILEGQMKTGFDLSLKWPNDILLNGKKIGGILIETNLNKKEFIIGAGVNVNQISFDESIAERSTSMKLASGIDIDCNELLLLVLRKLQVFLDFHENKSFGAIFEKWKSYHKYMGNLVKFATSGDTVLEAQVVDFQDDGAIKLRHSGIEIVYYTGDIRILDTFPA